MIYSLIRIFSCTGFGYLVSEVCGDDIKSMIALIVLFFTYGIMNYLQAKDDN